MSALIAAISAASVFSATLWWTLNVSPTTTEQLVVESFSLSVVAKRWANAIIQVS